mgnify:CR=1 FL=1
MRRYRVELQSGGRVYGDLVVYGNDNIVDAYRTLLRESGELIRDWIIEDNLTVTLTLIGCNDKKTDDFEYYSEN